jgi:hypothetical protein
MRQTKRPLLTEEPAGGLQVRLLCDVKTGMLTPSEARALQRLLEEGQPLAQVRHRYWQIVGARQARQRRFYSVALIVALLMALFAWSAFAQLPFLPGPGMPVYDAANHLQNTISAFEAIFQSAQWVIDLAPLESFEIAEAYAEDLALLREFAAEAAAIGIDLASVQAQLDGLFGLETAPTTSFEFRQRVGEINLRLWQVYGYAMRTQTLINTAIRTVEHIMALIETVAGLLGKLSVQQNLHQQIGKLHQLQAEANLVTTALAHAQSTEALVPGVLYQGIQNIVDQMMDDHPRR